MISLVLVLRHSIENRSLFQPIIVKLNLLASCLERFFPFLYFSVSNTFKVEKFHGLILLKHHNPLEVNEVMVSNPCFAVKLQHHLHLTYALRALLRTRQHFSSSTCPVLSQGSHFLPRLQPAIVLSFSTVRRQVVLGRPTSAYFMRSMMNSSNLI